ncbi:hypothetical protein M8R19_26765 [Pseudomonas sp. R3.Fl]|uniref:hypothetical protein n=1 Tax=Pseudomonas TaxID=286 RepID=UPI00201D8192|nr:hypothetical protein [Pseudomonas sp. R3.Fl]MCL6692296.1 hypothetical protein [Pseudomonas sp. R3.Fl]
MKLTMICEGGYISNNNFNSVLSGVGSNTLLVLSNAQANPVGGLTPIISAAGSRHLSLQIDGTKASESQAIQIINSASGSNTSINISSITSQTTQAVKNITQAGANKKLSIGIDCATASQNDVTNAISAATSRGLSFSVDSLNALTTAGVTAVFQAAQGKTFTASLDGKNTSGNKLKEVINAANGSAASLSVVNGSYIPMSDLLSAITLAGNRSLSLEFNATLITAQNLKSLAAAATNSTSLIIDIAQGITAPNLVDIINTSGTKKLSINFSAEQATNIQMQDAVGAGTSGTYISISAAQIPQLSVMLGMISSSGHTNLSPNYNGAQLVVTPTDGNWVVRALQAAQPTTQIVVSSVGLTNFTLSLILDILSAAG